MHVAFVPAVHILFYKDGVVYEKSESEDELGSFEDDEGDLVIIEDDLCRMKDTLEYDHGHELAQLEGLLREFEEDITSIFEGPERGLCGVIDFWTQTWVGLMSEVLDRLEGSDFPEDERLAAEEIGVV
ncbi:hypothetical protein NW762_010568 [Fusarium torreyae]|uniref:Uncharacterized protein n=1 Tax=Fusarium torreyae TaxID=1237075 RepID=A0A9W8RT76_9HYPO|nr:hypothetical protein NW762_010568 [Fusarium torreyae]